MRLTKADFVYQTVLYIIVILLLAAAAFPLIYVVSLSFVSETEWVASGGRVIIPGDPTIEAYKTVFRSSGATFARAFGISVIRTVLGTGFTIFFSMCVGYVLSRKGLPFKGLLLTMTLITILFGGGLIPTFLVLNAVGIYNTIWAMIIPGLVDSWSVLIFRQFFLNTPESIEESARIDGAGEITIMWKIVVPLSTAVIAALTLFAAVGHWNSWFDAAVYTRNAALKPFQLLMHDLFVATSIMTDLRTGGGMYDPNVRMTPQSIRMAITVLGTLPILCIYPFLQKYFTKGVYMGAVKE